MEPGSDSSYHRGAGRYYMTINAMSVSWRVTVEDQR
jgi:hypothetical protein